MKDVNTPAAVMVIRMKRLPRRHRIAHRRALIRRQPVRSIRGDEPASLLRDEMATRPGREGPRRTSRPASLGMSATISATPATKGVARRTA
jgi:hypothetical protein